MPSKKAIKTGRSCAVCKLPIWEDEPETAINAMTYHSPCYTIWLALDAHVGSKFRLFEEAESRKWSAYQGTLAESVNLRFQSYKPPTQWWLLIGSVFVAMVLAILLGHRINQIKAEGGVAKCDSPQCQMERGSDVVLPFETGVCSDGTKTWPMRKDGHCVESEANASNATVITSASEPPGAATQHTLELMADKNCWIRIEIDKTVWFEGVVRKNWEQSVSTSHGATVRDGCAGDISFNVDGKPLTPEQIGAHRTHHAGDVEVVELP